MKREFGDLSRTGYRMIAKGYTGCPGCMYTGSLRRDGNGEA